MAVAIANPAELDVRLEFARYLVCTGAINEAPGAVPCGICGAYACPGSYGQACVNWPDNGSDIVRDIG